MLAVEKTSPNFVQDTCLTSHIYEEDVHKKYTILFRDGSVISDRTAEDVARAVRYTENAVLQNEKLRSHLLGQVQKLDERLQNWCQEHSSEISTACLVPSVIQGKLWFAVMKRDRCYSEDFADNLSQLEIDIEDSENFDSIMFCVMDFPNMPRDQFERAIMGLHTA